VTLRNLTREQRRVFIIANGLLSYHSADLPDAIKWMRRAGVQCTSEDFRPHPQLHKSLDRMMSDDNISDDVKRRIPAQHMKLLRMKDSAIARRDLMQFLSTYED
jgi:hypothetical protein